MKKLILSLASIVFIISTQAQTQSAQLEYNNTRIGVLNGGDFFWDMTSAQYQVPKISGGGLSKSTIGTGAVWMGGEDLGGNLRLAAMTYRQRGQDFWPGPLSTKNGNPTSSNFDKIYKVSKEEIDAHIANSSSPIPAIADWPGNGDTTKGEPFQLAPFVDVDGNGMYEPTNGDYPKIKGLGATYCIYNDNGGLHTETTGRPIGIEIHQLIYQDVFTNNGTLIDDVNFASFTIINRSTRTIQNFIFGLFTDFDLGNFEDDFVGSDSATNMVYAYNGYDDDKGVLGYGLNPPAQNMMFLNQDMGSSMSYNNNNNPINGNPSIDSDFYNYLQANDRNGTPIYTNTRFAFGGDPVVGSGDIEDGVNLPGDRRILGSSKPFTLEPNVPICYDLAYVYARATSGGRLASITEMKNKAEIVQSAYDANTYGWKNISCKLGAHEVSETSGIFDRNFTQPAFSVYPNPSTGLYTIKGLKVSSPSFISNVTGQIVKQVDADASSFDLTDLEIGIYFLKTEVGTVRLVKM